MVRSATRILVIVLAMAGSVTTASAQTAADLQVAKQEFLLGKTYYNQAAYDQALKHFRESYRLSKRSDLLYNIARSYEALAQLKKAIEHYELYLKKTGKADSTTNARIRNLKARLAAQKPKPDATKPDATKPDATKPDATKPDATKPDATKPDATKPDATAATLPAGGSDTPKRGGGFNWMKWTGVGLMGVGAGLIGLGIGYGIRAMNRSSAAEDYYKSPPAGTTYPAFEDFKNTGETFQTISIIGLVAGALAAGGGVALFLLAPSDTAPTASTASHATPSHHAHVTPILTGNTVGLAGGFTF